LLVFLVDAPDTLLLLEHLLFVIAQTTTAARQEKQTRHDAGNAALNGYRRQERVSSKRARDSFLSLSQQGGCLGVSVHAVEVLYRDAAGAADEVVLASEHQHATADHAYRQVEEVRPRTELRGRQVIDNADERRPRIVGAVQLQQLLLRERPLR